jgi:hypothetical protein
VCQAADINAGPQGRDLGRKHSVLELAIIHEIRTCLFLLIHNHGRNKPRFCYFPAYGRDYRPRR